MRIVLISAVFLLLAGCGSSPIVPTPKNQVTSTDKTSFPPLGQVEKKTIGEVMVKKGEIVLRDALKITDQTKFNKEPGDSSIMTCALTVEPQTIFLRGKYETEDVKADCYGTVNTRRTLADGSTNFNCPGAPVITADICKSTSGDIFLAFLTMRADLKQDFDNLQFVKETTASKDNFLQEIVYNGRDGDKVKFVYKEYASNVDKPDYFQEFSSNLSESPFVTFRNAKIRVVEATNSNIRYMLEQNF